ncbi:hypothetical protein GUJ93_ZPchr0006g41880 [Zizania palustris]|uniref:KIB1-4 beta-propeller domain-containing protein n=1 Tax=Zizania palustris TaxID=103762 RepID=A0A8J5W3H1_ZIZPA|nr:hypothetical protein GUJ93_ZPchr0006g41880 [Zizania palustris]
MASSSSEQIRPAAPLSAGHQEGWRDWANLDEGLTKRMAEHALANDVADYLCFRAVCVPWRNSTEDPKPQNVLHPRFHPRRWILLPGPGRIGAADNLRRMRNLSSGERVAVNLPDLQGHAVAAGSGGSPGGVLVLVDERSLHVRLLNPLTAQFIDFPSLTPVFSRRRVGRMDKSFQDISRVTGAGIAGDSTVVLHFGFDNKLVSAKLGDNCWVVISEGNLLCSAFPFASNVYFANKEGLMVVDADAAPPRLVLAASWPSSDWTMVHMADSSSGELLVLIDKVHFKHGEDYLVDHRVFRLDNKAAGMLVPTMDLGEHALFVGDFSGALCVSSKDFRCIIPNTIYFQHDRFHRFYVRHISDGKTRLLFGTANGSLIDDLTSYVAWNART